MSQVTFPGNELNERREALGLSFDDVHKVTRIPVAHLRALESSDFEHLPSPTYAAGFLRSYCECLELSPERFVELYHAAVSPSTRLRIQQRVRQGSPLFRLARNIATWSAICGVIALCWLAWALVFRIDGSGNMDRGVQADELQSDEILIAPDKPLGVPDRSIP